MLTKLQPYITLVRQNHNYRRLWVAQIISNFGDWFGILALYAVIQRYSGSELLLGLIIVVKMLSLAFSSPLAGYIADRFNRRRLMVACNLFRGITVLGLLLIVSYETLWLAYLLTAIQMVFSAVFEPAKTSSIPNITTPQELVNANILSAASWSIIFTTGMAIGGFATELLGTDAVFIINGITYFFSAFFIFRATIPQAELSSSERRRTRNPLKGIADGFRFILSHKEVMRPTFAKAMFTSCLGALVYMLIIVAEDILLMGSIGLGILYAARGVGTGIGPVLGRRIFKSESSWIYAMGLCMVFGGVMYALVSTAEALLWMTLLVMLAHVASGSNWVMSTVLLQRRAPDAYRGRVFSTEWLLFTLAQSISVTGAALILEFELLTIRQTILLFSILLSSVGLFWLIRVVPGERKYNEHTETDETERPKAAAGSGTGTFPLKS